MAMVVMKILTLSVVPFNMWIYLGLQVAYKLLTVMTFLLLLSSQVWMIGGWQPPYSAAAVCM